MHPQRADGYQALQDQDSAPGHQLHRLPDGRVGQGHPDWRPQAFKAELKRRMAARESKRKGWKVSPGEPACFSQGRGRGEHPQARYAVQESALPCVEILRGCGEFWEAVELWDCSGVEEADSCLNSFVMRIVFVRL